MADFVNVGGGLFGLSQTGLTSPYGYLGQVGAFTFNLNQSYEAVTSTPEGATVGITDNNLDVCCWHDEYLTFPPFLGVLATNDATGAAAALGGGNVFISNIMLSPLSASRNIGATHTLTATVSMQDGNAVPGLTITFDVASGPNAGVERSSITDVNGVTSVSYVGLGGPGIDRVRASFVDPESSQFVASDFAVVSWSGVGCSFDCNGNMVPDECEISDGIVLDDDQDGVIDSCDICADTVPGTPVDSAGCPQVGACCFDAGVCFDDLPADGCVSIKGVFLGDALTCDGDPDQDGAVGCDDGCPFDMLKTEPGQYGCGFADNDLDNDTVADCRDNCLDTPNPNQADSDGDNFGDVCDGCPDDPSKVEAGACGCGIPDTDSDNDGVQDCNDGCPQDPDKIDPGICGCGVPEVLIDTDNDGVFDCLDLCPDTALGILVDEDGCPTSGACCFAAGVCAISTNASDCAAVNGTFQGIETICDDGCAFPGTGDFNGDLVINLDDFAHWPECMKGPSVMHPANRCFAFDFDGDGDVDAFDWAQFQIDFLAE